MIHTTRSAGMKVFPFQLEVNHSNSDMTKYGSTAGLTAFAYDMVLTFPDEVRPLDCDPGISFTKRMTQVKYLWRGQFTIGQFNCSDSSL